ncbi:hypothetical protein BGZ98_000383 [Dissophora globulifera]|nr:hypothetical protein BGZ98_000383 [Dissophora globulifera]
MVKRKSNTEEKGKAGKSTRLSQRRDVHEGDKPDEVLELQRLIVVGAFGRPSATRMTAVNYLLAMRSAPVPAEEDMAKFIHSRHPNVKPTALTELWRKLKEYFSAENQENLQRLATKMDITPMVAAFAGTALGLADVPSLSLPPFQLQPVQPEAPKASQAPQQLQKLQQPQEASCVSTSPISEGSGSRQSGSASTSSSNSSKSSSNSKLTASALCHLLADFAENVKKFTGEPWVLSSGTVVDDVLVAWAQRMASERLAESELHSFVIADVEDVLMAFEDEADKAEVHAVLEARPGEPLQELTDSERAYLALFAKDPKEVGELLDSGWKDISLDPPQSNPSNNFRKLVHHWMTHLHIVYRKNNYQLPAGESESWFLNMLWGPMALVLGAEEELQYKHGECNSTSSSLRKALGREHNQRQAVGRKADGMILGASTGLEICVLEAAKKDDGPRSTKTLHDTLKIAKFAKDMVDVMRARVPEAFHSRLVAYGFRLAAGSMYLYTLRRRSGRFDQLFYETSVAFPPKWNAITAEEITTVVGQVMALCKELTIYSTNIATWKKGYRVALVPIKPIIPTLSTPVSTPKLSPTSV